MNKNKFSYLNKQSKLISNLKKNNKNNKINNRKSLNKNMIIQNNKQLIPTE